MKKSIKDGRKVTLSCRVLPKDKLEIATKAQSLDLTLCQYTEALVLHNHGELIEQCAVNKENKISDCLPDDLKNGYTNTMDILKKRYPKYSEEQLLMAALRHATENHRAFIQRDLGVFLKRMENNYYNSKTNQHDN